MDQGPVVMYISSDEESDWCETESNDFDWLSELLVDGNKYTVDDSDEVVVLSEVNPKPRSRSAKPMVREHDDDCVVLDCDPDKLAKAVDDLADGSDEVLIVGEKGQVACRDFPHARHLCATFPFSTTPHQTHCDLCHCYVCDLQAPCVHWGTGISNSDHCHATDKAETWKTQRNDLKFIKNTPLPTSKFLDSSPAVAMPQANRHPPQISIHLSPDSRVQNQFPRPATIRPCSSSTNFPVSNTTNQDRSQQLGRVLARNRFPLCPVPQNFPRTRSANIQGSKCHHINNLGPRLGSYHPMFKRPVTTGASLSTTQSIYCSLNDNVSLDGTQYALKHASMAMSNDLNTITGENFSSSTHQIFPYSIMSSAVGNTVLPEAQTYDMPPSSNYSQNLYHQANQLQHNDQSIYQLGNQSPNDRQNLSQDYRFTASAVDSYDHNLVNDHTQNEQQHPIEHCQVQSTEYTCEPLKDFENWLLDDQSINVSLSPHLNDSSAQSVPLDACMHFFDIETSLNGLMHA